MYPYNKQLKQLMLTGQLTQSRFGSVRQLSNVFITEDFKIKRVPKTFEIMYSPRRNENLKFQFKYIVQTINGYSDDFLAPYSKIIRDDLEKGGLSYGQALKSMINGGDLWYKMVPGRNNVKMIYNSETYDQHVPPCNSFLIFNFTKVGQKRELSLLVSARSIDVYFGLTNDYVLWRFILFYLAKLNNAIPVNLSIAISNFHYYTKYEDRMHEFIGASPSTMRFPLPRQKPGSVKLFYGSELYHEEHLNYWDMSKVLPGSELLWV